MQFTKLDDSPMFRKQLQALEESAEALRERCQRFYKGCRKYTDGLGEAYDGDIAFANALETFGGGHDDPIGVAVGGPVMTRFTIALREIGTYKEILRSQVEHMLNDRLTQFVSIDLQDVKNVKVGEEHWTQHMTAVLSFTAVLTDLFTRGIQICTFCRVNLKSSYSFVNTKGYCLVWHP